jgi:hypothetical protein
MMEKAPETPVDITAHPGEADHLDDQKDLEPLQPGKNIILEERCQAKFLMGMGRKGARPIFKASMVENYNVPQRPGL